MRTKPDYYYMQSAVIPYRLRDDEVEILTITSRKKRRWVIPKGVKEPDLTPPASAAKEALEEAGIDGDVADTPAGVYSYEKWGGTCTVEVFAMEVSKIYDQWAEDFRDREWVSLAEATQRMEEQQLRRIMADFAVSLGVTFDTRAFQAQGPD